MADAVGASLAYSLIPPLIARRTTITNPPLLFFPLASYASPLINQYSLWNTIKQTCEETSSRLARLPDELEGDIILVGHSLGACMILRAIERGGDHHKRVRGVALGAAVSEREMDWNLVARSCDVIEIGWSKYDACIGTYIELVNSVQHCDLASPVFLAARRGRQLALRSVLNSAPSVFAEFDWMAVRIRSQLASRVLHRNPDRLLGRRVSVRDKFINGSP